MKEFIYRKGDVFLADLGIPHGSEQGGRRPVVIIQNDIRTASVTGRWWRRNRSRPLTKTASSGVSAYAALCKADHGE